MSILDRFKKSKEQTEKGSVARQVVENEEKKASKSGKEEKRKSGRVKEAKKVKKSQSEAAPEIATSASQRATATILAPIVTEKSAQLSDSGVMAFRVALTANKVMVRQAFRELYKVNPVKVRMINVRGKNLRFGRQTGKRMDYKKALITLPKGKRIDIFEGV